MATEKNNDYNFFVEIMYSISELIIEEVEESPVELGGLVPRPIKICVGPNLKIAYEAFQFIVKWNINRVDYIRFSLRDEILSRVTSSGIDDW